MSLPVCDRIAVTIATRLAAVLESGGWPLTFSVVRPTRLGIDSVQDNLVIVTVEDAQPDTDLSETGVLMGNPAVNAWVQIFKAQIICRDSSDELQTIQALQWQCAVDAVTLSGPSQSGYATWYTMGGDARCATILPVQFSNWDSDRATGVVELRVQVNYRTSENDPTSAR